LKTEQVMIKCNALKRTDVLIATQAVFIRVQSKAGTATKEKNNGLMPWMEKNEDTQKSRQ